MPDITFTIIALCVCVFACLTVLSRHIFHSAVWLSMCLLSVAGIYFYLDAQFVGVIQILVFIGGVITLFIFAIKLTAHIDDHSIKQFNKQIIPSSLVAIGFFVFLIQTITRSPWAVSEPAPSLTLKDLGISLMTTYLLPFELISLVLLAVMVGAIIIGKAGK